MMKLTKKQKEFLGYISRYMDEWRQSPSFDEICSYFGFNSYNTVTTYLKILERKGYIRLPDKKNRKRAVEIISPVEARQFEFPLLGRVAAGKPIEAVEIPGVIDIPSSMVGRSGDYFVLEVRGFSMQDEGILDGDFVVVRKQSTAERGETVVALINNEATVKKYYKRGDHVELRPAHDGVEPIMVKEGDLRIEGKVVGVIRYYK
jgi:repressor LexA